ncbi:Envelope glycoprotein [Fukomys damarensis]|uniref:Envelope glycoprotein n=1 Tax=Fukomys damarensis TaxID=885580 RepID=A0A091EEM2_FUKDA|nr:Envelope glycoprotein [Fukomys damarensis]
MAVFRIPVQVWIPLNTSNHFSTVWAQISSPSRRKRVAGAVVTGIISSIMALVSAITSAVALTGTLQNSANINDLQNTTTTALRTQQRINPHIGTGLAILQQQMDLFNEEVEGLWLHTRLDCDPRFQQLCLTPFPVKNHSEEVRRLSSLLRGS